MKSIRFLNGHGAILLAGFGLAAIGLALEPVRPRLSLPQGSGNEDAADPVVQEPEFPQLPAMGNSDSNGSMIAVTGIDLTGSSILYLIDTVNRQLAVYQANGGAPSTQGIKLVGARRIDLDLQLNGWNDRSEYSFEELESKFSELRAPAKPVK
jgi:hypothetical protein